ncbi:MAG: Nif3-like dinuclear metal center hexameric protein [Gemmatimonadota bacterium]
MSVGRDRLVAHLDGYLAIDEWEEKSLNGLQVEGAGIVDRVALATDAALATFAMASEAGARFLIVHHGLFWGQPLPMVGSHRARVAALLDAGISLYAAHLPLDAHPEVGNNAVLARLLGLRGLAPFGRWGGRAIGWRGDLPAPTDRARLAAALEALLGTRPDVLPFGPDEIRSVAIVSGAAADLVPEAAAAGVDAFVTGETSHVAWHQARELGVNLLFAGHYATETLGVRALGEHVSELFGVEIVFLDAPTGY